MTALLENIAALLEAAPPADAREPLLGEIERTLTDGYAHALALEAERLRLQRRLASVASSLQPGDGSGDDVELATIGRLLATSDERLASLRGTLAALRAHAHAIQAHQPLRA